MNDDWRGKGYSFFQNTRCEYFPCHPTDRPADFNCLFCYCPLYALGEDCGGAFSYTDEGVKDCTRCLFPHRRDNFGAVNDRFAAVARLARRKSPHDRR